MIAKLVNGPHAGLTIDVDNVAGFIIHAIADGKPAVYTLFSATPTDGCAVYVFDKHRTQQHQDTAA
jgi:hypothetical protein